MPIKNFFFFFFFVERPPIKNINTIEIANYIALIPLLLWGLSVKFNYKGTLVIYPSSIRIVCLINPKAIQLI